MPDARDGPHRPLLEAIAFAARAHQGQLRKDGQTPYVSHVFRVVFILRHVFGIDDPGVLTAAVLHDTIEDTTTDFDDIEKQFGQDVASWVGFANGPDVLPGTREPTTTWPIQKYLWSDFAVRSDDTVSYRVVPMVGSSNALQEKSELASSWSDPVTIGSETEQKISCYFNRGIVASQWLARLLPSLPDPAKDTTAKGGSWSRALPRRGIPSAIFLGARCVRNSLHC